LRFIQKATILFAEGLEEVFAR